MALAEENCKIDMPEKERGRTDDSDGDQATSQKETSVPSHIQMLLAMSGQVEKIELKKSEKGSQG